MESILTSDLLDSWLFSCQKHEFASLKTFLLSFEIVSAYDTRSIFKIGPFFICFSFYPFFFGKVFANEVNSHREQIIELDKTGTHLKYFSQKQDVVLIKNLLISVQGRWEKVVQRLVERGRSLDEARKRAKQVNLYRNSLNLAIHQF